MKTLIKNILDDLSIGDISLKSQKSRKLITNTNMAAIKSESVATEEINKKNEKEYLDYWTCDICGKHTHEVDYDYIGSGTNHLGCELESDNRLKQYEKEKEKAKHLIDKSVEDYERNKLSEEIVDATGIGYIYESNDGGKTVYKRKSGSDKKELIWSSDEKGKFNKTTAK